MLKKTSILLLTALFLSSPALISSNQSPNDSTLERITKPTEVYGPEEAEILLKIGNGGAGPTCLLQALSEDFIESENLFIRIAWLQTITRLTLENLKEGVIDVSLTYEEEPELLALAEGWASERTLVFNDHFLLVGPKENPADLESTDTVEEAFEKIAQTSTFFSRDDRSGTNERERKIWLSVDLKPWEEASWYTKKQVFPDAALTYSDEESLYTLTDRGTLLASKEKLNNTAVYVQHGQELMNRCHAMLQAESSEYAKRFLAYLKSPRAQKLIATYAGKRAPSGSCPLFTPASRDDFLEKNCLESLGFAPIDSNLSPDSAQGH